MTDRSAAPRNPLLAHLLECGPCRASALPLHLVDDLVPPPRLRRELLAAVGAGRPRWRPRPRRRSRARHHPRARRP